MRLGETERGDATIGDYDQVENVSRTHLVPGGAHLTASRSNLSRVFRAVRNISVVARWSHHHQIPCSTEPVDAALGGNIFLNHSLDLTGSRSVSESTQARVESA